jgi:hypothetical protein
MQAKVSILRIFIMAFSGRDSDSLNASPYTFFGDFKQRREAFELDVKTILQHTAKCDYNIRVITDEKTPLEEDTLYLRKTREGDIQYQFVTSGAKPTVETIHQKDLKDDKVHYKIPDSLNHDSVQRLLPKIFKIVSERHHYRPPLKAERIAKENPALILAKSRFTEEWCREAKFDPEKGYVRDMKRQWTQAISPLQYAAWAGDTPLVDEFLKMLSSDAKEQALQQLRDVRDNRLERPHLSAILRLGEAYKGYDALYLHQRRCDRESSWEELSEKQCQSVVNLIQWFCSSTPFNPVPTFKEFPEARSLSLVDGEVLNLSFNSREFGSSWGISKGRAHGALHTGFLHSNGDGSQPDLLAIFHFCRIRQQDLTMQITNLETELGRSHCLVM